MPAFTFEKLSPPDRRNPLPPNASPQPDKTRGLIGLIKDRFVERRLRKSLRRESGVAAGSKTPD
jgi:hypothetical protein